MRRLAFGVALSLAFALVAQPTAADEGSSFSLFVDQDVLHKPAFDQDFTMGIVLSWSGGSINCSGRRNLLRRIDGLFGKEASVCFDEGTSDPNLVVYENARFDVGDSAFTPSKEFLHVTDALPWDRPYANLLFVSVRRDVAKAARTAGSALTPRRARTTELTAGMLGLGIGEAAQKWIHRHVSRDVTPGGWRHQISEGGEPTLRYRRTQKWLLADRPIGGGSPTTQAPRRFDFRASLEESVGYYTYASAGLQMRLAPIPRLTRIESSWWMADHAPNPNVLAPEQASAEKDKELFFTAGISGDYWLYNALMQGQFRDSTVALKFGEPRPGIATLDRTVGHANAGVTGRLKNFSLSYAVTWHTAPFRGIDPFGKPVKRGHSWGGIYLSWRR